MATPSTLSYGTVVGQFLVSASDSADADTLPDAVPASGTVTFTPSAGVVLDYGTTPNPTAILRKPIVSTLDAQGYITGPDGTRGIKLIATDNPNVKPVGWTWVASYALKDDEGNDLRSLVTKPFLVPAGTTTDLVVAMPIEESNGVFLSKGDKGDKGDNNVLTIASVSVGEPDVSITGDSPNQQLSFRLPVSELSIGTVTTGPGTPGIVGPQGETGATGAKGDPGGIVLGTQLFSATDANTIVTSGVYRQVSGSSATYNYPTGGKGVLIVTAVAEGASAVINQEWTPLDIGVVSPNVFFRRKLVSGVWSSWRAYASIRTDQTAGRAIYQFDEVNNREQLVWGDTGNRALGASTITWGSVVTDPDVMLRRMGQYVTLTITRWTPPADQMVTPRNILTLPTGFRPGVSMYSLPFVNRASVPKLETVDLVSTGVLTANNASFAAGVNHYFAMTFPTADPWPLTLPGVASGSIPNT
jgi:hypothetical protein